MRKGIMLSRGSTTNSPNLHRNDVEKNRRMFMKDLYNRLAFLISPPPCKSSSQMMLEDAVTYIKILQQRLDRLKQKKLQLESRSDHITDNSRSAVIVVRELGSILEVFLICGLNKNFFLYQVISILEEEAARVVNVSQSTVEDRIIYRIYSQAVCSRIGIETSRVYERLKELIC